jgi:peptide chain release factor 3
MVGKRAGKPDRKTTGREPGENRETRKAATTVRRETTAPPQQRHDNERMTLQEEITRRRTFAVIAHPDAGKTTLTEKLLLFGGAIHVAGAVKSNKIKKGATSDFMEIERQRGISVATSVMGFEYEGCKINILDTPGHEDFAEDTYRTLTAVDSVIIVIDGAKGVEAQTRKLMEVCRMRSTPVIVFVNKLDRPSKEPFDLLDEVEKELHIRVRPLAFPISNGPTFKGVYNLYEKHLSLFTSDEKLTADASTVEISDLNSAELDARVGKQYADQLRSDVELVEGVYDPFDREAYLRGELAPVFFGSAVNNFGVRELLECFIRIAPSPRPAPTQTRMVEPSEPRMTGFVFKIHANMDPNHRDRIAFLKICSGIFERNKNYLYVRSGKQLKFSSPTAFMAEKKSVIDVAYPGDIVGLHDTGNFKIGDTFTEGEKLKFTGIPSFAPEQFRYIENADPMKFKQLAKGIDQLMDEGVAQLFTSSLNGRKIIGTVGALQFEVIQYRLEHEYNASCRWEPISIYKACWIESDNAEQLADFKRRKHTNMAVDKHGRDVFLADTSYALALAQENFKDIRFHFTSEF